MPNKKLTREYNDRRIELIRRIEICKKAKTDIAEFVKRLNKSLDYGIISYETYNNKLNFFLKEKSIEEWAEYYDDSIEYYERELENSKKIKIPAKSITIGVLLLILVIGVVFLRPSFTGYTIGQSSETFSDGYNTEGTKWGDIKGDRYYESCLKVNSKINFSAIEVTAKITRAIEREDITLAVYNHNEAADEPLKELGKCEVKDYSELWKSCIINNLELESGKYWVCAYARSGKKEDTYFTIAYQNEKDKRRAVWAGDYWQKSDEASYTIKAKFIKW